MKPTAPTSHETPYIWRKIILKRSFVLPYINQKHFLDNPLHEYEYGLCSQEIILRIFEIRKLVMSMKCRRQNEILDHQGDFCSFVFFFPRLYTV